MKIIEIRCCHECPFGKKIGLSDTFYCQNDSMEAEWNVTAYSDSIHSDCPLKDGPRKIEVFDQEYKKATIEYCPSCTLKKEGCPHINTSRINGRITGCHRYEKEKP
jgi:hypothetical protein